LGAQYRASVGAYTCHLIEIIRRVVVYVKNPQALCVRPIRLNLGCGVAARQGFVNVDLLDLPGVDVIADLNEPLSLLADDSVAEVISSHTLEHVRDFMVLMHEIHRVVCANGRVAITVPHFSNPHGYSDPTHVRFFGLYSMSYFSNSRDPFRREVPNFYTGIRFRIESVRLCFGRYGRIDRALGPLLDRIVNSSNWIQELYERRLCWLWPCTEIQWVLRCDK